MSWWGWNSDLQGEILLLQISNQFLNNFTNFCSNDKLGVLYTSTMSALWNRTIVHWFQFTGWCAGAGECIPEVCCRSQTNSVTMTPPIFVQLTSSEFCTYLQHLIYQINLLCIGFNLFLMPVGDGELLKCDGLHWNFKQWWCQQWLLAQSRRSLVQHASTAR